MSFFATALPDTLPDVFCWTKMGTEAGQGLEAILRRKELERRAGNGSFAWGIGNSLGTSPALARQALPDGEIEVVFSPMKSAPKAMDSEPTQLVLWLAYHSADSGLVDLPAHMLVTSRGNSASGLGKKSHYALICERHEEIQLAGKEGMLDAKYARNLMSLNPLGASQVTAMVRYSPTEAAEPEKPYLISFRARMYQEGFVRLGAPVPLNEVLRDLYDRLCQVSDVENWVEGVAELKRQARKYLMQVQKQASLFEVK